ncbi:MAG: NADH-quinone oxidoreductase subunit H [Spirochaetes bacterium]|nr:NADH-quinone oxidoreductase subunit H [Spirochaetota bacterium]
MSLLLALILSPLFLGIIVRTKAFFAGRKGQPLLQFYYDLVKLLRKGVVYSSSTTLVFRLSPWLALATVGTALFILPLPGYSGWISFPGDFFVLFSLLGVLRFSLVCSALDTGSSFEGMGASREMFISFLAEPALLLSFLVLAFGLEGYTLKEILSHPFSIGAGRTVALYFISVSLLIVLLAENSRIPFDDPNTHLELTMIHEVMVLDHSGPDLAGILYSSALKLWILGSLWVGISIPVRWGIFYIDVLVFLGSMGLLAVIIGIIESILARVRMIRVSHALSLATVLAGLALLWTIG